MTEIIDGRRRPLQRLAVAGLLLPAAFALCSQAGLRVGARAQFADRPPVVADFAVEPHDSEGRVWLSSRAVRDDGTPCTANSCEYQATTHRFTGVPWRPYAARVPFSLPYRVVNGVRVWDRSWTIYLRVRQRGSGGQRPSRVAQANYVDPSHPDVAGAPLQLPPQVAGSGTHDPAIVDFAITTTATVDDDAGVDRHGLKLDYTLRVANVPTARGLEIEIAQVPRRVFRFGDAPDESRRRVLKRLLYPLGQHVFTGELDAKVPVEHVTRFDVAEGDSNRTITFAARTYDGLLLEARLIAAAQLRVEEGELRVFTDSDTSNNHIVAEIAWDPVTVSTGKRSFVGAGRADDVCVKTGLAGDLVKLDARPGASFGADVPPWGETAWIDRGTLFMQDCGSASDGPRFVRAFRLASYPATAIRCLGLGRAACAGLNSRPRRSRSARWNGTARPAPGATPERSPNTGSRSPARRCVAQAPIAIERALRWTFRQRRPSPPGRAPRAAIGHASHSGPVTPSQPAADEPPSGVDAAHPGRERVAVTVVPVAAVAR